MPEYPIPEELANSKEQSADTESNEAVDEEIPEGSRLSKIEKLTVNWEGREISAIKKYVKFSEKLVNETGGVLGYSRYKIDLKPGGILKNQESYNQLLKDLFGDEYRRWYHEPRYSHLVNGVWGGGTRNEGLSKEKDLLGKPFDPKRFLIESAFNVLIGQETLRNFSTQYEVYSENGNYKFSEILRDKFSDPFKEFSQKFNNTIGWESLASIFKEVEESLGREMLIQFKIELTSILEQENVRLTTPFYLTEPNTPPAGRYKVEFDDYINVHFATENPIFAKYLDTVYTKHNKYDPSERESQFNDQSTGLSGLDTTDGFFYLSGDADDYAIPIVFAKDKLHFRWCMANVIFIPLEGEEKINIIQFHQKQYNIKHA